MKCSMLTRYIREAMSRARYRILEDGSHFGEVPGLEGVWANARSLERCRAELQEVVEEWLLLKLRDNDPIPKLGRCDLRRTAA
jgi:predicted RNase H-like HicB family nuclease